MIMYFMMNVKNKVSGLSTFYDETEYKNTLNQLVAMFHQTSIEHPSEWATMLSVLNEKEVALINYLMIDTENHKQLNSYQNYYITHDNDIAYLMGQSDCHNPDYLLSQILSKWSNYQFKPIINNIDTNKAQFNLFVDTNGFEKHIQDKSNPFIVFFDYAPSNHNFLLFNEGILNAFRQSYDAKYNGLNMRRANRAFMSIRQYGDYSLNKLFKEHYQFGFASIQKAQSNLEQLKQSLKTATRVTYSNEFYEYGGHLLLLFNNRVNIRNTWSIMQSFHNESGEKLFTPQQLIEVGMIMAHATVNAHNWQFNENLSTIHPYDFNFLKVDYQSRCSYIENKLNKSTIIYSDHKHNGIFEPMDVKPYKWSDFATIGHEQLGNLFNINPLYDSWISSYFSLENKRSLIHHHFDLIGIRDGISFVTKQNTLGIPYTLKSCHSDIRPLSILSKEKSVSLPEYETYHPHFVDTHGFEKFYGAFPLDDQQPRLKSDLEDLSKHSNYVPLTLNANAIELRPLLTYNKFEPKYNAITATPMVPEQLNNEVENFLQTYFKRGTTVITHERLLSIITIMQYIMPYVQPCLHNIKLINNELAQLEKNNPIQYIELNALAIKLFCFQHDVSVDSTILSKFKQQYQDTHPTIYPLINDVMWNFLYRKTHTEHLEQNTLSQFKTIVEQLNLQKLTFAMQAKPIFMKTLHKSIMEPIVVYTNIEDKDTLFSIRNSNLNHKVNKDSSDVFKVFQWWDTLLLSLNTMFSKMVRPFYAEQYVLSEYLEIKNEMRFIVHNGRITSAYPCERKASYLHTYLFGRIAPFFVDHHNTNGARVENRPLAAQLTRFARNAAKAHYKMVQQTGHLYENDVVPQSFLMMDVGTIYNAKTQQHEPIVIETHHEKMTFVMRSSWYGNNQARLYSSVYGEPFSMKEHWEFIFKEHSNSNVILDVKSYIRHYIEHLIKGKHSYGMSFEFIPHFQEAQVLRKELRQKGIPFNNIEDIIAYFANWSCLQNAWEDTHEFNVLKILEANQSVNDKGIQEFLTNKSATNLFNQSLLINLLIGRQQWLTKLPSCTDKDKQILERIFKIECQRLLNPILYIKQERCDNTSTRYEGSDFRVISVHHHNSTRNNRYSSIGLTHDEKKRILSNLVYQLKVARLTHQLSPELKMDIEKRLGRSGIRKMIVKPMHLNENITKYEYQCVEHEKFLPAFIELQFDKT